MNKQKPHKAKHLGNLQSGNYYIILKSGTSAKPLGLGVRTDHAQPTPNYWCAVDAGMGTSDIWTFTPLQGTDGFYLSIEVSDGRILYATFGAPDGDPIQLKPLDVVSEQFVLRSDDVGDGWVAINNHDKKRVFDAQGDNPSPGVPVICFKWNGGNNQQWKFIPA